MALVKHAIPSNLAYRPQVMFAGRLRKTPKIRGSSLCKLCLIEDGTVVLEDGSVMRRGSLFLIGQGLTLAKSATAGSRILHIGFICEPLDSRSNSGGRRGRTPIGRPNVQPITKWWGLSQQRFVLTAPSQKLVDLMQVIAAHWWLNDREQAVADANLNLLLAYLIPEFVHQGGEATAPASPPGTTGTTCEHGL